MVSNQRMKHVKGAVNFSFANFLQNDQSNPKRTVCLTGTKQLWLTAFLIGFKAWTVSLTLIYILQNLVLSLRQVWFPRTAILLVSVSSWDILCVEFQKVANSTFTQEKHPICAALKDSRSRIDKLWEWVLFTHYQKSQYSAYGDLCQNNRSNLICSDWLWKFSQSVALFQSLMSCIAIYTGSILNKTEPQIIQFRIQSLCS